ncbi:MAG: exodeoxyribonuclease VII small subunit [Polyangiaceae bacterium]|nr:exodeoxyribonuclease VII small subunit [Polyangiaceae bacterium]
MTASPAERPSDNDESFEASTERLGRIVEELEHGDLPLERSLALFEEGVALARRAQAQIERAERRVEELLGFDAQGRPVTKELAGAAPASSKPQGAR